MDRPANDAFTRSLVSELAGDSRVDGLVALGSMSGDGVLPDGFSDHDLFVLTVPAA